MVMVSAHETRLMVSQVGRQEGEERATRLTHHSGSLHSVSRTIVPVGEQVFKRLWDHPEVVHRDGYGANPHGPAGLTEESDRERERVSETLSAPA